MARLRLQPLLESQPDSRQILSALVAPGAALLLVVCSYWLWASRFVERLPESRLELLREDRLREAAEFARPWKIALAGIAVGGLGALIIVLRPQAWWLGLAGVTLGIGAGYWSLVLKRAAQGSPQWGPGANSRRRSG